MVLNRDSHIQEVLNQSIYFPFVSFLQNMLPLGNEKQAQRNVGWLVGFEANRFTISKGEAASSV